MAHYYNKEIQIYLYSDTEDENGISRVGYSLFKTDDPLLVDMQPYSSEKAKKDYGYDIECVRRMYCDIISQITEDCIVKYNDDFYKVEEIPWDDKYLEVLLSKTYKVVIL